MLLPSRVYTAAIAGCVFILLVSRFILLPLLFSNVGKRGPSDQSLINVDRQINNYHVSM
jgi:hypothetical protein